MMEGILTQRVTPLLKCVVLFLFIFTAKVLTSRPQESQDTKNNIQHLKPAHYVRTFTKYHHRRTIQWNNLQELSDYWPTQDHPKVIGKRSVDVINSNEFISTSDDSGSLNEIASDSVRGNFVGSLEKSAINVGKEDFSASHNAVSNDVKQYKVKAAMIVTDAPTTIGPTISCLYKIHSVTISVTPSYDEERNAQFMVENEIFGKY